MMTESQSVYHRHRQVLAAKIQLHRERLGMSQVELAAQLKRHQSRISKWERAEGDPSGADIWALATVFKVPLTYLCDPDCDDPADTPYDPGLVSSMTETERKVWDVYLEIGPELALQRLLGIRRPGRAPDDVGREPARTPMVETFRNRYATGLKAPKAADAAGAKKKSRP